MADPNARRAHGIFSQALDLESSARGAFVEAQCAGDEGLAAKVRRLLGAVERTTLFLETPALDASALVDAQEDASSIRAGGYRVLRVIGAGGMATVYEAEQENPRRTVALKVMSRALSGTTAVRRFQYEAEVLAKLQHPGIAQIFEAGTCDDGQGNSLPCFAMELIVGARTLTDHAVANRMPLAARLGMFAAVCDAVQHGHERGVIHRDLKPGNILVDAQGRPRVIDFGIARPSDVDGEGLTRLAGMGEMIGTLNFMSPEQCARPADVDIRADVYSLGAILYELISGRMPHNLSNISIAAAVRVIVEDAPPRLGRIAPTARGDLEAIVMRAMEKDAARRYPNAGALAADVRRYLRHEAIEARPPTTSRRAVLFVRRHRVLVASATTLMVTLLVASAVIATLAYRAVVESRRRLVAEQEAVRDRDAARRQSYAASIASAFLAYRAGEFGQARRRLDAAPEELRHWEWSLVAALIDRGDRAIAGHGDMIFALARSADGTRLATGSRDGTVSVWDAAGTRLATTGGGGGPVFAVAFNGAGTQVAIACDDGTLRIWDADGEAPRVVYKAAAGLEGVAWGPGGVVAVASRAGQCVIVDAVTGDVVRTIADGPGGIHGVAYAPDGRLLTWGRRGTIAVRPRDDQAAARRMEFEGGLACVAFGGPDGSLIAAGGSDGRVRVWRQDGTVVLDAVTPQSISTVRAVAISPDGSRLATGQVDRVIRLFRLDGSGGVEARSGHEETVSGLAFDPRGMSLYSASWDKTVRRWPIERPGRGPEGTLVGHTGHVLTAAYSPDGRFIASAGRDNTVRIWDAASGRVLHVLEGHTADVASLAFSPDSGRVASVSRGMLCVWNAAEGGQVSRAEMGEPMPNAVAYSPDGRLLLVAGLGWARTVATGPDAPAGTQISVAHESRINAARFAPDGRSFVTAARDGSVRVWNADGTLRHNLAGHTLDVMAVVYSADGSRIYTGSRDQTVRVWDAASGRCVQTLETDGQFVTSLALSPDGRRLAAGSWFAEVILWDIPSGERVAAFKGHNSAIRAIAFSPDGSTLLCGGHDGAMSTYDVKLRAASRP